MNKNPFVAFLLGFFPGLGHIYLQKVARGIVYMILFGFPFGLAVLIVVLGNGSEFFYFCLFISFLVWGLNMIHLIIGLLKNEHNTITQPIMHFSGHTGTSEQDYSYQTAPHPNTQAVRQAAQSERFLTIVLSFIPGLGHFYLGLMQRGFAFLITFFGLLTMTLFVTYITHREGFLIFLGILPVVWLYCLFDASQLAHRKFNGESLEDRSIFDEFESSREAGKKSQILTMILSVFPGAGHLYLGLQRRGLELMGAFLLSIYVLDSLRLSFFLFLIPILWCFSLFDAMKLAAKSSKEKLEDVPVLHWLKNQQKWIGGLLLFLGLYYLVDSLLLPIMERTEQGRIIISWVRNYLQIFVVSVILIGGGIRLLTGQRRDE